MAMNTLESISTALELVEEKKADLRKAFEELQARASLLSSPSSAFANLKWEDIDSHFTSFHSNLVQKFSLLPSEESKSQSQLTPKLEGKQKLNLDTVRPELRSFFERMDGLGLRKYILDRPSQRAAIRGEIADAWKHAQDPAMMVLGAMQGFYRDVHVPGSGSGRSADLVAVRTVCLLLLEEFMKANMEIGAEPKEKARALAAEWKGKIPVPSRGSGSTVAGDDEQGRLEKLGFLHLLAAFRLVENSEYEMNELIEYFVGIVRHRQAVELCRFLGFGERISEVVQKLIAKGEELLAVKFIFQFELTEKFPPLPLLEAYLSDSKDLAQKVNKNGKGSRQALNEAAAKDISSLKSVIRIIEDRNLESEYPKDILLKCVKKLEKVKTSGKRPATGSAHKTPQLSKKQKRYGTKHSQRNGPAGPSAVHERVTVNATAPPLPQPYVQTAGLLTDPYAAYGSAGSAAAAILYEAASAGVYGLSGTPTGFSGNLDPSMSSVYPSESQMQHSYYDSSLVYGGHGLPSRYIPAYYPQ